MDPEKPERVPPPPAEPQPEAADAPRLRPENDPLQDLHDAFNSIPPPARDAVETAPLDASPLVRMCNAIISNAIEKGASDFQVEAAKNNFYVRVRINGRLQQVMTLPLHVRIPTFNRFKTMADIPYWKPAPQSGTILIRYKDTEYNLAVQTSETAYGEMMTARIRTALPTLCALHKLNMSSYVQFNLENAISDGGLCLIVGPPGNGKTTLAYNLLNIANDIDVALATLEDGLTYRLSGVAQTYRNQRAGWTSARSLADSLIKQQIKMLFVGNVADADLLDAAVTCAEAGIVTIASVLATSVIGAISQLIRLGSAGPRLAAVLSGIVLQTLVGTICPDCRQEVPWTEELRQRMERWQGNGFWSPRDLLPPSVIYTGVGCDKCNNTGIRGRTGLYDYGDVNGEARALMQPQLLGTLARSDWAKFMAHLLLPPAYAAVWGGQVSLDEAERAIRPLTASARRLL